jgi:phage gp45-like
MSQEAITKFGDENIELTCEKVEINADYTAPVLSVVNDGNVPIYGLKVKIYTENGNSEATLDKSTDPTGLSKESTKEVHTPKIFPLME